MPNDRQKSFE